MKSKLNLEKAVKILAKKYPPQPHQATPCLEISSEVLQQYQHTEYTSIFPAIQMSSLDPDQVSAYVACLESVIEKEANLVRETEGGLRRCFRGVSVFAAYLFLLH